MVITSEWLQFGKIDSKLHSETNTYYQYDINDWPTCTNFMLCNNYTYVTNNKYYDYADINNKRFYSGTSHNGPSEKRTPTLQRTLAVLRIETTIAVIH